MYLSNVLNNLLAGTQLHVVLNPDPYLPSPEYLHQSQIHDVIKNSVVNAASGILSAHGACAFGEWLAALCTGLIEFSNELNVVYLDMVFRKTAFGNFIQTIPLHLLPDWQHFSQYLPQVRRGIQMAFEVAKTL